MSFLESIVKSLGLDLSSSVLPYRAVIFGNVAVYVENVKKIISYEEDEILVAVKKGIVKIEGKALKIQKYVDGDLSVVGKVLGVNYDKAE